MSEINTMKTKRIIPASLVSLGILLSNSASYAQNSDDYEALERSNWSLSTNRNEADSFSAIDGDTRSRWTTRQSQRDGQYFEINLNDTVSFDRIILDSNRSSNDYPRAYEVQVSNDGSSWDTIAASSSDTDSETVIDFSQQTASQVRIEQNGSDNRFWWSIHEVTLLLLLDDDNNSGDNSGDADSDFSDSSTWSLSASNSRNLSRALDGSANTRWTTGQSQRDGQFYQIDFNTVKTFDNLRLDTAPNPDDYPREYEVLISQDGQNWQTIASGTPSPDSQTNITFAEQSAAFLRIEQHGSASRNWWSIHELTIALGEQETLPDGLHPDITRVADIAPEEILRSPGGTGWKDSYSVGDQCYCDTTFDHDIGDIRVDTTVGNITVREACALIGEGPGAQGRPIYNDVQCGNGPANDAGDEDYCPGRVDIGKEGCPQIGPTWKF